MIISGHVPALRLPRRGILSPTRALSEYAIDFTQDPSAIAAWVAKPEHYTIATGVSEWRAVNNPLLAWVQATAGDQPAIDANNFLIGNGSDFMTLNAAGAAALNAYGGNNFTLVTVMRGDTAGGGVFVMYADFSEGALRNHTASIFRRDTGLDVTNQHRRLINATQTNVTLAVDETTAHNYYCARMPRNATQVLRRGVDSANGDTVENLALPTDFDGPSCAIFHTTTAAGLNRYTGRMSAVAIYGGDRSVAEQDQDITDLTALGLIL